MSDTPEIPEDSPQRAADRGREADLGIAVDKRPSLGNPGVVRGLLSEFAASLVAIRKLYVTEAIAADDAKARVAESAREYGGVVMGRDPRYAALPWNDPTRLGRRIRLLVPDADGIDDPGELLFLAVAASLVELFAAHEAGDVSDSQAEKAVGDALSDTADLILGVR